MSDVACPFSAVDNAVQCCSGEGFGVLEHTHQFITRLRHKEPTLQLVFFLCLHATILEPDLNLALREAQGVCDFDPSPSCEVAVEVKLLLQFQGLIAGVCLPSPLGSLSRV